MPSCSQGTKRAQFPAIPKQVTCPRVLRQDIRVTPALVLAAVFVVTLIGIGLLYFVGEVLRWWLGL